MNHSRVYQNLNFLLHLKEAAVSARKNLLSNMISGQVEAIAEVATRVVNGVINPLRRDVQLFERKRLLLRTLASNRVSSSRKKALLRRHHSIVPVLLRIRYVISTILDEVREA